MVLSERELAVHYISSWSTAAMMGFNERGISMSRTELVELMNQCEKIVSERCDSVCQGEFWDILDEIANETFDQGGKELDGVIIAQQAKVREGRL